MKKIIFITIIVILVPTIIVGFNHKEEILYKIKYGSINNVVIKVKKTKTKEIEDVPLEKYVLGVVAGEMPVTFNIEALKAQAVASRTYALKKKELKNDYDVEDGTNNQVYITKEDMIRKWNTNYNINYNIIKKAVEETKGEVILYENNLIDAMFFSTSNGYTENSEDVFSSEKPYLVSVESSWDKEESPVFNSTAEVSKQEFLFNLGLPDNDVVQISDIIYTKGNRVKTLKINGKIFEGKEIRKIFNLKSSCFTIKEENDKITFNVIGYGHGVGMSQYGANAMAKKGYKYKDILKYYYKNCEIKKLN